MLLEGKNVIITGASRGIGRGVATVFAKNGANIAFTYLSSTDKAKSLENELKLFGVKAKGYKSDASNFISAQEFSKSVIDDFGSIDVLVNNAGITKDGLLMRMTENDFNSVMQINMNSVFNMTKAVIKPMMKAKNGSIINMSSVVGVKGNAGQTNYSASKAGIIGFTKSTALELGSRNIRCNAIAPGFIETQMTAAIPFVTRQMGRRLSSLGQGGLPIDVAEVIGFFVSPQAAGINGNVVRVCGQSLLGA